MIITKNIRRFFCWRCPQVCLFPLRKSCLKRKKRKFTRNIQAPSSTNQKNTSFDYGTFRQFNALLPNQRVDALITPGKKAWSPLSKVKRDRSILKAQLAASASKRRLLAGKSHRDHAKIAKLKVLNNVRGYSNPFTAWVVHEGQFDVAHPLPLSLEGAIGSVPRLWDSPLHNRNDDFSFLREKEVPTRPCV